MDCTATDTQIQEPRLYVASGISKDTHLPAYGLIDTNGTWVCPPHYDKI